MCYNRRMTLLSWFAAQLHPGAPGLWLVLDLLFALGLLLAGSWILATRQRLLRALRLLLVPWLALLAGAISPQWMGMAGVDWQVGLTLGLGFVLVMLALLGLTHLSVREPHLPPAARAESSLDVALAAGLEQFHWAFQRGALLILMPTWPGALEAPAYWAIWIATLLALPGIWLHRQGLTRLYALVALVGTAILFFYTRNFWLCWVLHAGVMLVGGATFARTEPGRRASMLSQTETDTVAHARPVQNPRSL